MVKTIPGLIGRQKRGKNIGKRYITIYISGTGEEVQGFQVPLFFCSNIAIEAQRFQTGSTSDATTCHVLKWYKEYVNVMDLYLRLPKGSYDFVLPA